MKLSKVDVLKKQTNDWLSIINLSKQSTHTELYEEEKKQMFTYVNNFITKLTIDKERLKNLSNYYNNEIETKKKKIK